MGIHSVRIGKVYAIISESGLIYLTHTGVLKMGSGSGHCTVDCTDCLCSVSTSLQHDMQPRYRAEALVVLMSYTNIFLILLPLCIFSRQLCFVGEIVGDRIERMPSEQARQVSKL